uniref:tRNA-splicing endonuclease subunit Sen54 n=1 Tax=Aceria tosichella TaxID=561515 RepID=A0A6G1S3A4_9ACAR
MKRNYPPDEKSADLQQEERQIIEQRLNQLYSTTQARNVLVTNKTTYLEQEHHVRLEPGGIGQLKGFTQYARDSNYHYLLPYQALYLLESRQILIYYNELPLSIAEAYKLLLKSTSDFQNYVVFSHLNRIGYFCFPHTIVDVNSDPKVSALSHGRHHGYETHLEKILDDKTKPLLSGHDLIGKTPKEIMEALRPHGPQDLDDMWRRRPDDSEVSFDVYKRETYTKNKPKDSRQGRPDYCVIVQDKSSTAFPSDHVIEFCNDSQNCNKYLFAIVDADGSLSFVQCDTLKACDLDLGTHSSSVDLQLLRCYQTKVGPSG